MLIVFLNCHFGSKEENELEDKKNEKKFNLGTSGRGYLSAFKEDNMILREKINK